jgi:hypothetical protein
MLVFSRMKFFPPDARKRSLLCRDDSLEGVRKFIGRRISIVEGIWLFPIKLQVEEESLRRVEM